MMSSDDAASRINPSSRRTNSLGFAKADCHTCSDLKRACDRQRPRCGNCQREQRKCGGYVLDLVWKDRSLSETPFRTAATTSRHVAADGRAPSERQFKFKQGRPRKKRKSQEYSVNEVPEAALSGESTSSSSADQTFIPIAETSPWPDLMDEAGLLSATAAAAGYDTWFGENGQSSSVDDHLPILSVPSGQTWPSPLAADDETFWQDLPSPARSPQKQVSLSFAGDGFIPNLSQLPFGPFSPMDNASPSAGTLGSIEFVPHSDDVISEEDYQLSRIIEAPLSRGVLYNDQAHKLGSVLSMYDEEFCVIPLTMDCSTNPFRVRKETCESSRFLLHAVLAVSAQHLAKKSDDTTLATEMMIHRSTATHLYREALSRSSALALLDTLLVLLNLDATQSASGTWDVHLIGAYKLLEAAGGAEVCRLSSRIRAQVAMLIWWDVTIGFISRQEPIFPLKYLEILLEYDHSDGWTFFALNGCPGQFILAMARLAKLASIFEKVATMEWTTFNTFPVDLIVEEMKNWKNVDDIYFQDVEASEDMDAKRDRFHCVEAWRHAILLYTLRVFIEKQDQRGLQSISHLARVIMDHIRCIKQTVIIQKQVLIPLFLAAAEIEDKADRDFVREYCKHWNSTSRYFMFGTAEMMIERIWADWHTSTRDVYWWGSKVGGGSLSKSRQEDPMANKLLLG